jgi:hypothetical protein
MRLLSRLLAFPVLTLPLVTAAGCGDDSDGGGDEGLSSEVGSGGPGSSGAEGGTGEEDTGPPAIDPVPVQGLRITHINANQGVAVKVADGVNWVDGPQRNARMVSDRNTILRVYWELDDGWVDRDVECRLTLGLPGGEVREKVSVVEDVYRDSNPRFLDSTCFFALVAEEGETAQGVTYQISVWDVQSGGEGLTQHPSVAPASGMQQIGFEGSAMDMKITVVPVTYNGNTPPVMENRQALEDGLFQQNPLRNIDLNVRQSVSTGNPSLSNMLSLRQQLHAQHAAANNNYYFALVDTGAQSGTIGLAYLGSLYGAGLWLNSLSMTVGTLVHEVGHDQGLGHVACPEVDGMPPYESYPYSEGLIGVTGFGIRNFQLYGPDLNYAYMSYCGQGNGQWASDWDWSRNWNRIAEFSGSGFHVDKEPVLHGAIDPDGSEVWWTAQDVIKEELYSGNHEIVIESDQGTHEGLMTVEVASDGQTLLLTAPLPEGINIREANISRRFLEDTLAVELPTEKVFHDLNVNKELGN